MDGILIVHKPPGMTSHDVVDYLRRLTGAKKAGHTGTLDPGATGVLPVCLGRATRIIRYLPGDKAYRAEVTFGVATATGDSFGNVVRTADASALSEEELFAALKHFQGPLEQVPPMTSAVWHQGKRLYELARQGLEVERKPRPVMIFDLRLVGVSGLGTATPRAVLELSCSAGTYVRSLCIDLGEKLGCGAHMSALVRTRAGPFTLENALPLEEIAALHRRGGLPGVLVSPAEALAHLPAVQVKPTAVPAVKSGNRLYLPGVAGSGDEIDRLESGRPFRLLAGGDLLAVARKREDPTGKPYFQPETVL
ncbi:MAG: tRNA pseudouridine(55) synthase TruB [Armatimonadetes bacterium]|nr:tRNA pseudouridine(55) synthase TruB [Armatimonadota bacterium]